MPDCFEDACRQAALELAELVIRKQRDYGHDNINTFGDFGLLVRVNDKVARLRNLYGKQAVNESINDSWDDLGGYSIIRKMRQRGTFDLELKEVKHE
jgi:hypothetical protein